MSRIEYRYTILREGFDLVEAADPALHVLFRHIEVRAIIDNVSRDKRLHARDVEAGQVFALSLRKLHHLQFNSINFDLTGRNGLGNHHTFWSLRAPLLL